MKNLTLIGLILITLTSCNHYKWLIKHPEICNCDTVIINNYYNNIYDQPPYFQKEIIIPGYNFVLPEKWDSIVDNQLQLW